MSHKRHTPSEYREMLTVVKQYAVGFTNKKGYNTNKIENLTKWQRKKIRNYYAEIEQLTARPFHIYKTRDTKKLKAVQKAAQHTKYLPSLKTAFVPTDGKNTPKISFDNKHNVVFKIGNVIKVNIPIDIFDLLKDTELAIENAIAPYPELKRFAIQAGKYEIANTYGAKILPREISKLMMKYGIETQNNYFGNWLKGIIGYNFENQIDMKEYIIQREKAKREIREERYNAKKRRKYRKSRGH